MRALLVHPLDGLGNVGRRQADVLETWASMTVQEMLHVRVGILFERLSQHQLEVQTEMKTVSNTRKKNKESLLAQS